MLPRRVIRRALLLTALASALSAPSALAAETLAVVAPVTDNYKAQWNADPSVRELRTWSSYDSITAGGATWTPPAPSAIVVSSGAITLNASDGRSGSLAARVTQGSASTLIRYDHPARGSKFGPLVTISNPASLSATPVRVTLTLSSGGAVLATGVVEYRAEPAFANVATDHIEYNGPGGRWWIGGSPIRTDWEPRPAVPATVSAGVVSAPVIRAPRITRVRMPLRVRTPRVIVRVSGRAMGSSRIKYVRFQVGSSRYSKWIRTSSSYALRLPAGRTASYRVRIQLRNAAGMNSQVVTRRVRCVCG